MEVVQHKDFEFPWLPQAPVYSNAFRLNIRAFLAGPWARRVPIAGVHKASAYIVQLKSSAGTTLLHVYEERLNDKDGAVCDQCRCMGEQQGLLKHRSS